MSEQEQPGKPSGISVQLGSDEWRIEGTGETGAEDKTIRLSVWRAGQALCQPLELSETDLVDLLRRACRAGVLSENFIGRLHDEIEI